MTKPPDSGPPSGRDASRYVRYPSGRDVTPDQTNGPPTVGPDSTTPSGDTARGQRLPPVEPPLAARGRRPSPVETPLRHGGGLAPAAPRPRAPHEQQPEGHPVEEAGPSRADAPPAAAGPRQEVTAARAEENVVTLPLPRRELAELALSARDVVPLLDCDGNDDAVCAYLDALIQLAHSSESGGGTVVVIDGTHLIELASQAVAAAQARTADQRLLLDALRRAGEIAGATGVGAGAVAPVAAAAVGDEVLKEMVKVAIETALGGTLLLGASVLIRIIRSRSNKEG